MQTTLKTAVTFTGVGLHSGEVARVTVLPASAEYGIWFRRTDVTDRDPMIAARWNAVVPSSLCTRLENDQGVGVSTIEHLMAALAGCGIHNALIEIDGPEVPILDGSAAPFVKTFVSKGIQRLSSPIRALRVLERVEVREGDAIARLEPSDGFEIDFRIEFDEAAIGTQAKRLPMANGAFIHELCDSRTFCRRSDIDVMRAQGLALGGVPGKNAVVFDGALVASPGGLRHSDEAVRHKMLDAMGDLALATCPLIGRYTGIRAGHSLTNKLLHAFFARPGGYQSILCDQSMAARLPGSGIGRSDIVGLPHAA